ncbi:GumC family protein [Aureimonas sp. AU40]|uniref:GumC family protein n=1 Tax=Aureimonas sp. AU40 TaxID=1637747 RepID=UPI0007853730|nr:Wzz/FepE/Etk N-terminal domain-containing protein [Aureimonas sp. AU40]
MLHRVHPAAHTPEAGSAILSPTELLVQIWGIVRRHMLLIGAAVAVSLALAVIYLLLAPPQFTATATMVMDARRSTTMMNPSVSANVAETPLDNPTVESQLEILRSENIALAVVRQLKLDEDPDFTRPTGLGAMKRSLRSLVSSGEPPTPEQRLRAAVAEVDNNLYVRRIGVTFVFEISFTSTSPQLAAEVANAVADAYVTDQLDAKYQSTRRAGVWLQERLAELGAQASEADRAVVDFRATNNIVDAGGGRLLSEQQLTELNTQLSTARGNASEARARLDRVEQMIGSDLADSTLTDALRNEVIIKLRNQYSELTKREADLAKRLGPQHQAVANVRGEIAEAKRSINEELGRIGEGYRSDYEIARARVATIEASLKEAIGQSQLSSQAQVQLRALESSAQSYRALYDSFLQRYRETVQQQSFPLTEARLITSASPPGQKSKPRTSMTLAGALVLGGIAGFGLAFLRDATDKTLRRPSDVERQLGVPCIASVPAVETVRGKEAGGLREVVARPIARFAESIRAIKVAVDFHPTERGPQIVGFVSGLPGEGKTTLAANFAELAAQSGARTVLVDCDLRNPSLTRRLAGSARVRLTDLRDGTAAAHAMLRTRDGRLDFLPAVQLEDGISSNDVLSSRAMAETLAHLKQHYDYVVVDLPPLLPIIDARASADMIDCFVFTVEWGGTLIDNARRSLELSARIQRRTVGVVLNKVDGRQAKRYFEYEYAPGKSAYYG